MTRKAADPTIPISGGRGWASASSRPASASALALPKTTMNASEANSTTASRLPRTVSAAVRAPMTSTARGGAPSSSAFLIAEERMLVMTNPTST